MQFAARGHSTRSSDLNRPPSSSRLRRHANLCKCAAGIMSAHFFRTGRFKKCKPSLSHLRCPCPLLNSPSFSLLSSFPAVYSAACTTIPVCIDFCRAAPSCIQAFCIKARRRLQDSSAVCTAAGGRREEGVKSPGACADRINNKKSTMSAGTGRESQREGNKVMREREKGARERATLPR